jgi:PII-like signaling protein
MRLEGPARRLTVFVDEADRAPHSKKPLFCEIVHLAHGAGLAGASAFHGIEGYGASRHVHVNRILSLSPDLPVAVVIVDTPEKVDAFLPRVQALIPDGLITVEDLRAIGHVGRRDAAPAEDGTAPDEDPGMLRWLGHRGSAAHGESTAARRGSGRRWSGERGAQRPAQAEGAESAEQAGADVGHRVEPRPVLQ